MSHSYHNLQITFLYIDKNNSLKYKKENIYTHIKLRFTCNKPSYQFWQMNQRPHGLFRSNVGNIDLTNLGMSTMASMILVGSDDI